MNAIPATLLAGGLILALLSAKYDNRPKGKMFFAVAVALIVVAFVIIKIGG